MTAQSTQISLSGLAKRLVDNGLLDNEKAQQALEQALKNKIPFVTHLVQSDLLASNVIAKATSEEFGVPLFDLSAIDPQVIPSNLVSEKLIRKHHALPLFKRGNRLFVALSDPTNLQALDEFKFHVGINTDLVLVEEQKLNKLIEKTLQAQESATIANMTDSSLDGLDIVTDDELPEDTSDIEADDAPIVRYVHKILLDAINSGSSDIHFEPYEQKYRVRLRQDGILREVASPPVSLAARLSARLKIMSRLDISERRVPQDGRFKLKISRTRSIDFRVSTCPTLYGEKVVLRILDSSVAKLNINLLGFEDEQKDEVLKAIHQPQGMVLVTGPTGSGKTVTLYTALNILNKAECNISTAEDPVEINLPGINQVNINNKAGLVFSSALRCFLRQDPDIVMVGEIRDLETAEIAIKAAQTGHMVLSTLHTNSASETLTRLMNMGIAPFNLATAVSLIIAQRLARCLCKHCKEEKKIPEASLIEQGFDKETVAGGLTIFGPTGCDHCNNGYSGRVGIYEVMKLSIEIQRIIMNHGNSLDIATQASKEGCHNLRASGLLKVAQGVTSLEEINRITKD